MRHQSLPTLEEAVSGTLYGSGADGQVIEIDPSELVEITDQPFRPYKPDKLSDLADSIRNNGQQQPCIVRKLNGKYIILAGRNRKRACEMVGCKVKCIVRECSDAEANLILTETNLCQRHELLPSELAKGYKLQKEAYEAQGNRKSTAAIAASVKKNTDKAINVKTIQRYIALADLDPSLLDLVDEGRIPVMAGVTLTAASQSDQQRLAEYLVQNSAQRVSGTEAEKLVALKDWNPDKLSDFFEGRFDEEESVPSGESPVTVYFDDPDVQQERKKTEETEGEDDDPEPPATKKRESSSKSKPEKHQEEWVTFTAGEKTYDVAFSTSGVRVMPHGDDLVLAEGSLAEVAELVINKYLSDDPK